MRKILLSAAGGGLALALALAACKAPDGAETARNGAAKTAASPGDLRRQQPVQAPHTEEIVRRVTVAEAKGMVERGEAVLVDVRTKEQYDGGHIKGALSLPLGEAAARASEMPKDKLVIFYCA